MSSLIRLLTELVPTVAPVTAQTKNANKKQKALNFLDKYGFNVIIRIFGVILQQIPRKWGSPHRGRAYGDRFGQYA